MNLDLYGHYPPPSYLEIPIRVCCVGRRPATLLRAFVGQAPVAATRVFAKFQGDRRQIKSQITFLCLVIDYHTQHGATDLACIYESPVTGITLHDPESIFLTPDLDESLNLEEVLYLNATPEELANALFKE